MQRPHEPSQEGPGGRVRPGGRVPDSTGLRRSYERHALDRAAVPADPFILFDAWFAEAAGAGLDEPNAMVLATASADGVPSARTVLLKGHGPDGFRFFTNHTSRKGQELLANPRAAVVFPWHPMRRQVIATGPVHRISEEEAAAYWRTRPYGSRLGAWASERQSSVLGSRAELEARFAELTETWPTPAEVPLPDFWGGYLLVPATVEFWQGGPDRLHDRIRYRRPQEEEPAAAGWLVERLSP